MMCVVEISLIANYYPCYHLDDVVCTIFGWGSKYNIKAHHMADCRRKRAKGVSETHGPNRTERA